MLNNIKKGMDFIDLFDFNKEMLVYLLNLASKLKQDHKSGLSRPILKDKTLAMIFAKPSLRTRVSFEVGIQQLGGTAIILKQDEINLGVRETIADTARVLARYVDGVMIRTFSHNDVTEFAKYSDIPVINALTDLSHPCQILADFLTIREKFGDFQNIKLAYLGDGNNVANSLLEGCSIMGIDISIGCPPGYEPDANYIRKAHEAAKISGSRIKITKDPFEAVKGSKIIYTDVWASMGQESEAQQRKEIFNAYQVNNNILGYADDDFIVLHCLPAHRGEEITKEVFEKHVNIIFEQAENRLHVQKAIMASIM
jgi:ornithine carbamoyltransferase